MAVDALLVDAMRVRPRATRRCRGNSLMEVLAAVLVVGVAALGVAKLELLNGQTNRSALERSIATMLADDMIERMRANPDAVYAAIAEGDPPPVFVDCLAASCAPAQLASFDIAAWKCSLGSWHDAAPCQGARQAGALAPTDRQPGLPAGDGGIVFAGGLATVTVSWRGAVSASVSVSGHR